MKKKIVKTTLITLAVLLLLGGGYVGMQLWRGAALEGGNFPDPDRVVVSMVENGEIVERELTRQEKKALVELFEVKRSVEENGVRIGVGASDFFEHYEKYGAVKFFYLADQTYAKSEHEYCGCGVYLGKGEPKPHKYNAIYLVVSDGYVFAYEVYNGTVLYCNGVYVCRDVDRGALLSAYFPKKEGEE